MSDPEIGKMLRRLEVLERQTRARRPHGKTPSQGLIYARFVVVVEEREELRRALKPVLIERLSKRISSTTPGANLQRASL
jgi:hypothetical protein